jgi:3-methyl-2-oxobutanoate hydroxymethyltransferase
LIVEGGAHAVKLEGTAEEFGPTIRGILRAGIPVMGHIGLMPQSILRLGGYKVQGKEEHARARLVEEACELEAAGCFSLVLECVVSSLATEITQAIGIPTIGIGAGLGCDGQVLVVHDMLGLGKYSTFAKVYADLSVPMRKAVTDYVQEVKTGKFPGPEHSF